MTVQTHSAPSRSALWTEAMRLLIIEDDREAVSYLVKAFREAGHVADHATDGLDGYGLACDGAYDVLIVDRMLPKLDGLSLIRSLREQAVTTPVLILSALGQVDDRVKGLRAGGDDYLAETLCILRACSPASRRWRGAADRPSGARRGNRLPAWAISTLDRLSHKVTRAGEDDRAATAGIPPARVSDAATPGKVVTRTMLLERVWDYHFRSADQRDRRARLAACSAKIDKRLRRADAAYRFAEPDTSCVPTRRGPRDVARPSVRLPPHARSRSCFGPPRSS